MLDTPDTPTIDTLVDRLNEMDLGREFTAADTLKNVVLKTRAPGSGEWELLVVGVPGDREVDLKRIGGQLRASRSRRPSRPTSLEAPRLVKGYIGPQILGEAGASDGPLPPGVDPLFRRLAGRSCAR